MKIEIKNFSNTVRAVKSAGVTKTYRNTESAFVGIGAVDGKPVLRWWNREILFIQTVEGSVAEPGYCEVIADPLVLSSAQDIILEVSDGYLLGHGEQEYRWPIHSEEPEMVPEGRAPEELSLEIPTEVFASMFSRIATTADTDHPYWSKVELKADNDQLRLAATNGHRLAVAYLATQAPSGFVVHVPARVAKVLGIMSGPTLRVGHDPEFENCHWISSGREDLRFFAAPELKFPEINDLLTQPRPHTLCVATKELKNTMKELSAIKDALSHHWQLSSQGCAITAKGELVEIEARLSSAEYQGQDLEVYFSPQYIRDALRILKGDTVTVAFASEAEGVLFSGADSLQYLLMPMRPPK